MENSSSWDKYFEQTANIDASGSTTWDSNAGFTPIGTYFGTYFTGNYDGQGYAIDGIFIDRSAAGQALFNTDNATISNLGVTNVDITGTTLCAGLVGEDYQTTISNCYTTGSVVGTAEYIGGLVGQAYNSGTISNSYSSCSVTGKNQVGGLAGELWGVTVSNCYSRGNVFRASGETGTQIGAICGNYQSTPTIEYSYSTGSVTYTGSSDPTDKGFVGDGTGTSTQNFFDSGASNQSSGLGALATSTADMKKGWTFSDSGWSMTTWYIDPGFNDGYPYLSWQPGSGSPVPVQIAAIDVQAEAEGVVLRWNTATEVDNAGFDVERRAISEGGFGIADWMKIGFVEGHGTVTSPQVYAFIDANAPPGSYEYRLKQVDRSGSFEYTRSFRVEVGTAPMEFAIGQNYPNPFNPSTTLSYTLATDGQVTLRIYDALGRKVADLVDEVQQAGMAHTTVFDASGMASGMYYARLEAGGKALTRKIVLMK